MASTESHAAHYTVSFAEEIKFSDPPEILGRGTFGMVLLGEYRGTQVAVKRVIPPQDDEKKGGRNSTLWTKSTAGDGIAKIFNHVRDSGDAPPETNPSTNNDSESAGNVSWAGLSMSVNGITSGMVSGVAPRINKGNRQKRGPTLKQLRAEFMQEMRYLSKLRHPCVTTVMGATIDKGDPMLIMGMFFALIFYF